MKRLIIAAAISAVAGAAQAQIPTPSLYGSLGYTKKEESNVQGGQLRLGGRFTPYFGIEGELALGVEPHTLSFDSVPPLSFKTQLRHELAAYAVGYYPVTPNFDVFGRVGYGNTWLKRTFVQPPFVSAAKFDTDSVNYGVGGQYFLDGKNGVRLDYLRQNYGSGQRDENTWSVAYTRRF